LAQAHAKFSSRSFLKELVFELPGAFVCAEDFRLDFL